MALGLRGSRVAYAKGALHLGLLILLQVNGQPDHLLSQRNLSSCPRDIKEASYKTLIRPQLEYLADRIKFSIRFHKGSGYSSGTVQIASEANRPVPDE